MTGKKEVAGPLLWGAGVGRGCAMLRRPNSQWADHARCASLRCMTDTAAHEERFTVLEIKAAYLEKLTMDLNEVVISQGKVLNELVERVAVLERAQQVTAEEDRDMPEERPPHY